MRYEGYYNIPIKTSMTGQRNQSNGHLSSLWSPRGGAAY